MGEPDIDVLVIGASQAGLAAGHHLSRRRLQFHVVERSRRIGDSWRCRYDSLTLFTPRALSQICGHPQTGEAYGYPTRDEFADYLEAFARQAPLTVTLGVGVMVLEQAARGFRAWLSDGSIVDCRTVIVATGGFQKSLRPAPSSGFAGTVLQLDPESYRSPAGVSQGSVLVVGDGASGRDIAHDLAGAAGVKVWLARGRPRKLLPERVLGVNTWWWLSTLGFLTTRPGSWLGRRMREADPFPDRGRSDAALIARGVTLTPRLAEATDSTAVFSDRSRVAVGTVIWAVGYRDDFGWLRVRGAKDQAGNVLHEAGVSPVGGLYYVGRPWQRNRASALVMGASDDAQFVVDHLAGRR